MVLGWKALDKLCPLVATFHYHKVCIEFEYISKIRYKSYVIEGRLHKQKHTYLSSRLEAASSSVSAGRQTSLHSLTSQNSLSFLLVSVARQPSMDAGSPSKLFVPSALPVPRSSFLSSTANADSLSATFCAVAGSVSYEVLVPLIWDEFESSCDPSPTTESFDRSVRLSAGLRGELDAASPALSAWEAWRRSIRVPDPPARGLSVVSKSLVTSFRGGLAARTAPMQVRHAVLTLLSEVQDKSLIMFKSIHVQKFHLFRRWRNRSSKMYKRKHRSMQIEIIKVRCHHYKSQPTHVIYCNCKQSIPKKSTDYSFGKIGMWVWYNSLGFKMWIILTSSLSHWRH